MKHGIIEQLAHLATPISELAPDPHNARLHGERNIKEIVASYRQHGQRKPIVVQRVADDGTQMVVRAGNGQMEAAKKLGWTHLAVVIVDERDREAIAFALRDNRTAELATWDPQVLKDELGQFATDGVAADELGWTVDEVQELLVTDDADDGSVDPDDVKNEVRIFSTEQVIDAAFDHYREVGFPYPDPSLHEAMQELNRLASMPLNQLLRTTVGYGVADKFQRHRFAAAAEKMKAPITAFNDDNELRYVLKLLQETQSRDLNDSGVRSICGLVHGTQACANFRPGFAAHMYRRFCPPGGTVLDTSTGYGGRLVGAIASTVVSHYIGIDPNVPTHKGNAELLDWLGVRAVGFNATLINSPAEDVSLDGFPDDCDFAFTSPPYFRKEHYSDDDTQSWKRYPEAESWRTGFLVPMMRLQHHALKSGAHAAVNIADVLLGGTRYPLGKWTVDAAVEVGFEYTTTLQFEMSRRFGANMKDEVATEPVFVFKKP